MVANARPEWKTVEHGGTRDQFWLPSLGAVGGMPLLP